MSSVMHPKCTAGKSTFSEDDDHVGEVRKKMLPVAGIELASLALYSRSLSDCVIPMRLHFFNDNDA